MVNDLEVDIDTMLKNIENYLTGTGQVMGTQLLIGFQYIFRGIIVRDWETGNECETKYHEHNKILVKRCVRYYCDRWNERCNRRYSDSIRRRYLLEWVNKEIISVENLLHPQVSKYISIGSEKIVTMANDIIQKWLVAMHSIKKM